MEKEYITTDEYIFTRYPNSSKRNHRVYYVSFIDGKRETLHHYIYRTQIGRIPNGFVVHHINGNPLDNSLNNLDVISRSEHQSLHAKEMWKKADKDKRQRMIPKETFNKYVWHRSKKGRKQLSERAKNQYRGKIICEVCRKKAIVKNVEAVVCSLKCRRVRASRIWRKKYPDYWKEHYGNLKGK